MSEIVGFLMNIAERYGYIGAFIASLLGNITIALPTPYAFLIAALGSTLNPFILGIVCGFGSTIGELVAYALGYVGRTAMNENQKEKLDIVKRILDKYGSLVIILFAVTPLPDDLILIPMGMMKYDYKTIIITVLIGKTILALFLAYAGYYGLEYVDTVYQSTGWAGVIFSLLLLAGVIIALLKIDWEKLIDRL
jgi:membrane protein YqaA with SNARE-associated domain